jgi:hypothetical protein
VATVLPSPEAGPCSKPKRATLFLKLPFLLITGYSVKLAPLPAKQTSWQWKKQYWPTAVSGEWKN